MINSDIWRLRWSEPGAWKEVQGWGAPATWPPFYQGSSEGYLGSEKLSSYFPSPQSHQISLVSCFHFYHCRYPGCCHSSEHVWPDHSAEHKQKAETVSRMQTNIFSLSENSGQFWTLHFIQKREENKMLHGMKKWIHRKETRSGGGEKSIPVCINHAVGADGNYGYAEGQRNVFVHSHTSEPAWDAFSTLLKLVPKEVETYNANNANPALEHSWFSLQHVFSAVRVILSLWCDRGSTDTHTWVLLFGENSQWIPWSWSFFNNSTSWSVFLLFILQQFAKEYELSVYSYI